MKSIDKAPPTNLIQTFLKRAVIYIRVSTEKQAEKVSPDAQEQDGREYAEKQGYRVVAVYRDIERYRVGGRMVEPSGTRRDRPGLKAMLAGAYAGNFDVIIAWREDRLYRGLRPMMDVLDCLKETEVTVELVKETFDKTFAPVKAWVASMELEARRERMSMGMKGRLAQGKIAGGSSAVPYGYNYDAEQGTYVVNEDEAEWVQQIWRWYAEGTTISEIRRRLILAGVPQKGTKKPRKYEWCDNVIRRIVRREDYYTGVFISRWAGQVFEISIPTIIEAELYHAVKERQAQWKAHPAGKSRQVNDSGQPVHPVYALAPGVVYCAACGVKMRVISYKKRNRQGEHTGKHHDYYRCNNISRLRSFPGCAKMVRIAETDVRIWEKVWGLVAEPRALEQALATRIAELEAQEMDGEGECKRIEKELENLSLERRKYITWAGKDIITEQDLQTQLCTLNEQERLLRRDLADARLLVGGHAGQLLKLVELYRERVKIGYEAANVELDTPACSEAQLNARRRIIEGLVTKVEVAEDGNVSVHAKISFDSPVAFEAKEVYTSETFSTK